MSRHVRIHARLPIALLLAFALLFAFVPMTVSALVPGGTSGIWSWSAYDINGVSITACSQTSGSVEIPAQLDIGGGTMKDVVAIAADAFNGSGLTGITIPSSVRVIGNNAFKNCVGLTSLSIPDAVTSFGTSVFYGDTSLVTVHLPTGLASIPAYTFYNNAALTTVNVPDSITSIGDYGFGYCSKLPGFTIPKGVTSIGLAAFRSCTSLTAIHLPASCLTIGDSAFAGCGNVTSLDLPDGILSIGNSSFANLGITSVKIPGTVISLGTHTFYGSTSLRNAYFFNPSTTIGGYCLDGTDILNGHVWGYFSSTAKAYAIDPAHDPYPFVELDDYIGILEAGDSWTTCYDQTFDGREVLSLGGHVTMPGATSGQVKVYAAVDGGEPTLIATFFTEYLPLVESAEPLGRFFNYGGAWTGDFTLPAGLSAGPHYLRLFAGDPTEVYSPEQQIRFYASGLDLSPTPGASPTVTAGVTGDPNPATGDPVSTLPWVLLAVAAVAALLVFRKPARSR